MTYDLRRVTARRHDSSHPENPSLYRDQLRLKVAFFYSKLYLRILRPQWNALLPDSDRLPRSLRTALDQLDTEIQKLYEEAALAA